MQTIHLVKARYAGCTYHKPSRVILTSLRFPNNRVIFSYDSAGGCTSDQAEKWLKEHGFNPVFVGELPTGFIFGVTRFGPLNSNKELPHD